MDTYSLIKTIINDLGFVIGFLMLIVVIVIGLMMFYLRSVIVSDLDEKTRVKIENLEKKLKLTFRDEKIRRDLTIYSAKMSIDKKIELFMKVSNDYNNLMNAFKYLPSVPKEKINPLMKDVQNTKNEIINNSIFLGGELTEILLKINEKLLDSIYGRRVVDKLNNPLASAEIKKDEKQIRLNIIKNNNDIRNLFVKSRELLVKNLYTDQDIERYNISEGQNELIETARNTFIKEEFQE